MSYNVMHYGETWADLRKSVKAARDAYLRKMERLEKYADSAQGRKDIEACKAEFQAQLEAARAVAAPKFNDAISGMKANISKPDMQPPTPEMLATLQMLELRDNVEADEIEAAAKVMGNNDAALKTLRDVLQRKGRVIPSSVKTFEARTRDAVDTLQRAASSLLQWDGRTGEQVLSDYFEARNNYQWGGGDPVPSNALASRSVADIEARSYYRDTVKAVIGDDVPASVVDALDK